MTVLTATCDIMSSSKWSNLITQRTSIFKVAAEKQERDLGQHPELVWTSSSCGTAVEQRQFYCDHVPALGFQLASQK